MGPRAPLGAALPARPRPTGLPVALSPPLPPFPQAGPARWRLAPSPPTPPPPTPPPPPPGVNVLAPGRRAPWSPARVPGARRPLRLSPRRRPHPPAPPPPPAGPAGKCSPLAEAGTALPPTDPPPKRVRRAFQGQAPEDLHPTVFLQKAPPTTPLKAPLPSETLLRARIKTLPLFSPLWSSPTQWLWRRDTSPTQTPYKNTFSLRKVHTFQ